MKKRKNQKKSLFNALTAAVLCVCMCAFLCAGCGGNAGQGAAASNEKESVEDAADASAAAGISGQEQAADSGKLKEMNVVLDWYPNALHAFLYTVIERGYFADEGLDVKIRFPANENDALALVAAGKAEIGLYYQQDIIQAVANQNVHIKSIGAVVQSPLNVILSLADKNITSPKDLVGKRVGFAGTALSESLVWAMMKANGQNPDSVDLVNVGFELMSSMTTDQVDATIGCLVNHEVPQLEEEGFDVNYFLVNEYGIPNYYEAVFLANDEMIENEPEVLAGFLRACDKGFDDFQADPDACLQILLNNQNEENFPLSPTVEKKSCETLIPLMETEDAPFLSQTEQTWQENIDWMFENGLIDKKIPVSDVVADVN